MSEFPKGHVFIKICGIKDERDIKILSKSGVDGTGFVVGRVKSKRRIPISRAKELAFMARDKGLISFLVTTSPSPEEILEYIRHIKPDAVQLHGDITPEEVERIKENFSGKIFKVLKVPIKAENPEMKAKKLLFLQKRYEIDGLVLDTNHNEGGSGISHDWRVSQIVIERAKIPVFLAGGLNQKNVQQALCLHPAGIDVSSGVETDGKKDGEKISAFVKEVRNFESPNQDH